MPFSLELSYFEILTSRRGVTNVSYKVPATVPCMVLRRELRQLHKINLLFYLLSQAYIYRLYRFFFAKSTALVVMQNKSNKYNFFFSLAISYRALESL